MAYRRAALSRMRTRNAETTEAAEEPHCMSRPMRRRTCSSLRPPGTLARHVPPRERSDTRKLRREGLVGDSRDTTARPPGGKTCCLLRVINAAMGPGCSAGALYSCTDEKTASFQGARDIFLFSPLCQCESGVHQPMKSLLAPRPHPWSARTAHGEKCVLTCQPVSRPRRLRPCGSTPDAPRSLCPSPSTLGCRRGFKLQASVTEEQRTWLERLSTAECLSTDFAHAQIGKRGHVVREARQ
ncbi:hypothetical protein K466DRAFT_165570 [Polyporus arcularius HHB13444]|uniref:Uncharacterized protein n=1 Tax=Polyporus arcularius HHB13444 TaxID=1314778 RepID=A0A5C3P8R2_9APHY|nr:hypothetical protein K466DRAFT_165570 [Polyporus arcularius HHB13444]